jgi:hypothetical protein
MGALALIERAVFYHPEFESSTIEEKRYQGFGHTLLLNVFSSPFIYKW